MSSQPINKKQSACARQQRLKTALQERHPRYPSSKHIARAGGEQPSGGSQKQPERSRNVSRLQHRHRQGAEGHELTLRNEDDPCHTEDKDNRKTEKTIDGAVDDSILRKNDGDTGVHKRPSLRRPLAPQARGDEMY